MRYHVKVLCGVLVLGSLIGVYEIDEVLSRKKEDARILKSHALNFNPETVDSLKLTSQNWSLQLVRTGKKWGLKSTDNDEKIDQKRIKKLVTNLSKLTYQQKNTKHNSQDFKIFGFQKPHAEVVMAKGQKPIVHFVIGDALEFQKDANSGNLSYYALDKLNQRVFVVAAKSLSQILEGNRLDYFSKKIGAFSADEVSTIQVVANNKNIQLHRNSGKWVSASYKNYSLDENFISSFIEQYRALSADKLIEMKPTDVSQDFYHLKKPAAVITFFNKNHKIIQKIVLGLKKNGIFSPISSHLIAHLELNTWADLVPKFSQFLNRDVMLGLPPHSQISEVVLPKQLQKDHNKNGADLFFVRKNQNWYASPTQELKSEDSTQKKNEAVTNFLTTLEYTTASDLILHASKQDLKTFGLLDPQQTFILDYGQKTEAFRIGHRVPLDEKKVYLKREHSDVVFITDASLLDDLGDLMKESTSHP